MTHKVYPEVMFTLLTIATTAAVLGAVARFGADSRPGFDEMQPLS